MNKNVKINNPMKVITGPDTRWSYANVWEPKSINGGTPKYSVSLIISKSDTKTIAKIEAAIEAAYKEGEAKLKGNGKSVPALSVIKTPLRDGDMERPDDPAYSCNHCFAQIVICGECGEMFRRIHWNNRGCKSIVWRCISRLEPTGQECHARTVNETILENVVVQAINTLLGDKSTY